MATQTAVTHNIAGSRYQLARRIGGTTKLLRGTTVNRTYGKLKKLYISLFLLTIFGPIYYLVPGMALCNRKLGSATVGAQQLVAGLKI